jgi:hypothetical protein|eukprot:COSAG01_NODE_604_length_14894_cov_24.503211_10_plen_61_part_00
MAPVQKAATATAAVRKTPGTASNRPSKIWLGAQLQSRALLCRAYARTADRSQAGPAQAGR